MSDGRLRTTSFADQQNQQTGSNDAADPAMDNLTGISITQTPDGKKITTVVATSGGSENTTQEISYSDTRVIGSGSFGIVFQVHLHNTNTTVAIKKVLQDRRFKNRELQMMKMLRHPNVIDLIYYFYSSGTKDEIYLNLVLEYVPETVYQVTRTYARRREHVPMLHVKLYTYQIFRALAFLHAKGICHRDIKPHNLLVDPATGVLKLCDFGSAKILMPDQPNVSYICSRYYRAPELIFGAQNYTTSIDVWSAGCVLAELIIGRPLFPGESGVDQLVEIIKVLGTPTKEQIEAMNPNYKAFKFPQIKAHLWSEILAEGATPEVMELASLLLEYMPHRRITMLNAMAHPFFDELRMPAAGAPLVLPDLFSFTPEEMSANPQAYQELIPLHRRM